jgi:hypothetical protein
MLHAVFQARNRQTVICSCCGRVEQRRMLTLDSGLLVCMEGIDWKGSSYYYYYYTSISACRPKGRH